MAMFNSYVKLPEGNEKRTMVTMGVLFPAATNGNEVLSNEIFIDALTNCGACAVLVSEENEADLPCRCDPSAIDWGPPMCK